MQDHVEFGKSIHPMIMVSKLTMSFQPEDIQAILSGKTALRYSGSDIEAMKAVASAHQNRNLQEFETALATYTHGKLYWMRRGMAY